VITKNRTYMWSFVIVFCLLLNYEKEIYKERQLNLTNINLSTRGEAKYKLI
jgi:hypothetical protein